MAVFTPNLMVVHPSVPVKSVKEMIALAKARPDQILYASGGNGTNSHLATALFVSMARIRMIHVPYKGSTPGITERLASDGSEVVASSPEEFAALIKAELAKWATVVKAAGIAPM